mgnify:CR=1 FL=1|jgi:hypothetical protein
MPPQARSTSSLGEPRIPLSFKVVVDPDDLPGIQTQDFKANRAVPPIDVSNELQANMNELMQVIEHEKTLATRMKKSLDDIASVVQTGVEFDREISGAAVVDMQVRTEPPLGVGFTVGCPTARCYLKSPVATGACVATGLPPGLQT